MKRVPSLSALPILVLSLIILPCQSRVLASAPLPVLNGVTVTFPHADGGRIEFQPFAGAQDYRAYAVDANGNPVQPIIYSCAGKRPWATLPASGVEERTIDGTVLGYARNSEVDATLGYVSTVPGPGLVPVYASASNMKGRFNTFAASRQTVYTTSLATQVSFVNQGWRPDGIRFYVPGPAVRSVPLTQVYMMNENDWSGSSLLYFTPGPEYDYRVTANHQQVVPAFKVFASNAPGLVALKRINADYWQGTRMDTLWPDEGSTFTDALNEGDNYLVRSITLSGIMRPTRFAVEALNSGCPDQGVIADIAAPLTVDGTIVHYPWYTLAQMIAQNPSGVYQNGQFAPSNAPQAIARSYVTLVPSLAYREQIPGELPWDYFEDFRPAKIEPAFTPVADCGTSDCWGAQAFTSSFGNAYFIGTVPGLRSVGISQGQLNMRIADYGSDVNGKVQVVLSHTAILSPTSGFLHITFDTEFTGTYRRYPQLYISDQAGAPYYNMVNGKSIVMNIIRDVQDHTANAWVRNVELQYCDHQTWDTNNQCPGYRFDESSAGNHDWANYGTQDPYFAKLAPTPLFEQFSGMQKMTRFDVEIGKDSKGVPKAFIWMDNKRVGCILLPANALPQPGPVYITLGDTSYHSGVDSHYGVWDGLSNVSNELEEEHHFDNVGWRNRVTEPTGWNYNTLPCMESSSLGGM